MLYEKEKPFNKNIFFSTLNKISLETSLKYQNNIKEIQKQIVINKKKITYEIIDIAFEGYFYFK